MHLNHHVRSHSSLFKKTKNKKNKNLGSTPRKQSKDKKQTQNHNREQHSFKTDQNANEQELSITEMCIKPKVYLNIVIKTGYLSKARNKNKKQKV